MKKITFIHLFHGVEILKTTIAYSVVDMYELLQNYLVVGILEIKNI